MDFTALTAVQVTILGTMIIGSTEFISRLRAKDFWVAATIFTAAVLGGLIGMHFKVDFFDGAMVGLGASGTIKLFGSVGNKSTPAPSTLLEKSKV